MTPLTPSILHSCSRLSSACAEERDDDHDHDDDHDGDHDDNDDDNHDDDHDDDQDNDDGDHDGQVLTLVWVMLVEFFRPWFRRQGYWSGF